MSQSAPSPGKIVGGRYRLEQLLVQGGMGNVWRAHHISLDAPVAVKFISPLVSEDDEAIGRFMLEAQSAAALRSSHIVQVFDFGIEDGTPFIAMELLLGESLAERLRRKGTLSPLDTGRILSQVARGIQYAHTLGIVHRDLKPDNIFLAIEGDQEVSKILDFGIVKSNSSALRLRASTTTKAGALLGSPYYVSPEQAEGDLDIDHRSDLWALGIIVFECLTGTRPFDSEALAALLIKICTHPSPRPSAMAPVPLGFDEWFFRATEKSRDRRFQSVREMTDAYARLLDSTVAKLAEFPSLSGEAVSGSVSSAPVELQQFHARTALSSTPHPATVNNHAPRFERTLVQKNPANGQALAGLAALSLLGLAFAVGRFAQPQSGTLVHDGRHAKSSSEATPSTAQVTRATPEREERRQLDNAPPSNPPVNKPPEITLLASEADSLDTRMSGGKRPSSPSPSAGTRVRRVPSAPQVGPAATPNVPGNPGDAPNPSAARAATNSLFRHRKVPGETNSEHGSPSQ